MTETEARRELKAVNARLAIQEAKGLPYDDRLLQKQRRLNNILDEYAKEKAGA